MSKSSDRQAGILDEMSTPSTNRSWVKKGFEASTLVLRSGFTRRECSVCDLGQEMGTQSVIDDVIGDVEM